MKKSGYLTNFFDNYSLLGTIWSNGYSKTYKATSNKNKQICAVRSFPREIYESTSAKAKAFQDIMEKMLKLDHPNVEKVQEIYRDDEYYYVVEEFIEGSELLDYIKTVPKLTEKTVSGLIKELLQGLSYAHKLLLAHANISFSNLLVSMKEGMPVLKLIGFAGSSKLLDEKDTKMKDIIFYSPEKTLGKEYSDFTSDVWACGIICCSLLTGLIPFKVSNNVADTKKQIRNLDITINNFKDGPWTKVSNEAKSFVLRMLDKNPETRSSSGALLYDKWIGNSIDSELLTEDIKKLCINSSHLKNISALQNSVLYYISGKVKTGVVQTKLTNLLKALDTAKSGKITKDEFIRTVQKVGIATKSEAVKIFEQMDLTKDGLLDYTEIVSGFFGKALIMREENLKATFDKLDTDKSGDLDYNELVNILCTEASEKDLAAKIRAELSEYKGKKIKYQQFLELMRKSV